jgi:hypothetical protein
MPAHHGGRGFLSQQFVLVTLQNAPLGDVLHAKQNIRVLANLVKHLASVQAHRAMSEAGELVFDFVVLHHAMLGYDLFQ